MYLSLIKNRSAALGLSFFFLSILCFYSFKSVKPILAPEDGAWQQVVSTDDGQFTHTLLFSGKYFSWTIYKTDDGAFQSTKGGSWKNNGKGIEVLYEFISLDSNLVGKTETWKLQQKGKTLKLKGSELKSAWTNIEEEFSPLAGPWLFSGRKRDGKIQRVDMTTRPRKTMKILTGSRFQWIAYNTETGKFHGTGGGTYTAKDGVYTENIEFFSRDDSRVGAALEFKFEIKDGDWHHSGNNSRGEPMYELWSRRK
ncbi:MAG: membrane or secreted protein [Bacteroidota bacterium]